MPSPPESPTYPANLTVHKPTHENGRPHKRAKREESPLRTGPSQVTRTVIPKADTATDIGDDEDEVKDIADDQINKDEGANEDVDKQDEDEEQCSICLQPLVDRTVIPTCAHEFCFECILVWTEQSRKCPLCAQPIREHLIHHIRARYDYQKHYLTPLRSRSPNQLLPLASSGNNNGRSNANTGRDRPWGRRARMAAEERQVADALEREIAKRKWVYEHRLFAKHVASNAYTRYRPAPTPAAFAANPVLVARATAFLRRELRVWDDQVDGEWLTAYVVSLMKTVDIRSEAAVRLLAEFLDVDGREVAEHFAHEVYAYLRSPYRDLGVYDSVVQYDTPANVPPPAALDQSRRWRPAPSHSRSRSRERGGSRRERDAKDTKGKYKGKRPAHDGDVEVIDVDMDSNVDDNVRQGASTSRDTWERREHGKRKKGERRRTRKEVIDVDADSDSDPRDDGHVRRSRSRSRSRSRRGEHREGGKGKRRERDERGGKGKRAAEVEVIDVDMYDGDGSRGGTRKERERERHAQRRETRRSRSGSRAHEERRDNGKDKQRARSSSWTRERDARSRRDGKEKRPERMRDAGVIDVDMDDDPPFHAKDHPERHRPGKGEKKLVKGRGRDSEGISADSLDGERQRSPAARNGSNGTEHLGEREVADLDPPPASAPAAPAAPAAPDVQTAAKRILVRPPRNLGLLGAVYAHLGAPARKPKLPPPGDVPTESMSMSNTNEPEKAASAALLAPPEHEQPQKPVLFARISDIASITSTSTPAPSSNATSPPDTPVLASLDSEQQPRQSHSAREIMARTRARLAKLKNQPVAGVSVPASPTPPTPLGTPPPGAVDARARLMDRLEEEKRQVAADATAIPLAEADAGVQAEAVLRKKAQLRVRLAAAKREQESERVLLADDDAVAVVGGDGREEELKLRIKARR